MTFRIAALSALATAAALAGAVFVGSPAQLSDLQNLRRAERADLAGAAAVVRDGCALLNEQLAGLPHGVAVVVLALEDAALGAVLPQEPAVVVAAR